MKSRKKEKNERLHALGRRVSSSESQILFILLKALALLLVIPFVLILLILARCTSVTEGNGSDCVSRLGENTQGERISGERINK